MASSSASASPLRMTSPQRLILTIAVLASFVAFLDGTIVNVALPAIENELGGGITTQQWVVDAYLITLSALILFAGSLSDVFGRVLIMRIGLIGFGIASIAIALAPSALILIIARAVQGAAGAFLVPSSLALITSTFRGAAQGRAIGIWTSFTTGAMVVGPLLGGLFVDLLSWRYAFLINVLPIGIALWLLARAPHPAEPSTNRRIDWLAAVLCTAGLGLTVFALIEQPRFGWTSPAIWLPLAVGILAFILFLLRERTATSPILPLDLFTARNFWTGNISTLFIYAALSLNGFVIVVYLQQGVGLAATLAGLASMPVTILMILLSSRAGALAGRLGPRLFMTLGPAIMSVGSLLLLTVASDFSYWWQVFPSMLVFGFGLAITVSPLTAAILGAIDTHRSGIASAVNNAVSRIAGLLVIAMLVPILGGSLNLEGFHRAAIFCAILLALGALTSWAGIRGGLTDAADQAAAADAARGSATTP